MSGNPAIPRFYEKRCLQGHGRPNDPTSEGLPSTRGYQGVTRALVIKIKDDLRMFAPFGRHKHAYQDGNEVKLENRML